MPNFFYSYHAEINQSCMLRVAATEANKGAGQHYNEVGTDGESQNTPPRQRGDNKPPDEPHTLESDARQGSVANGRQPTTSAYTLGD